MRHVYSSGLILMLLAGALGAQEPADTIELEELVVTATRIPQPVSRTASSTTVISGEDLRAQGIDHVLDALRQYTGITIVQTGSFGGATSLFMRGGESDFVQVLIDGVQVNMPGGAFDFGTLTTDNIDRIEIVRGPTSALYGSDAVTGVVQIFTRRGRGALHGSVALRSGTYDSWRWGADLAGGGERAEYAFSFSRTTSDGLYSFNNNYRNTVVSGRVGLHPDDLTDASLTIRYSDNQFNFPTDGSGQLVDSNAFNFGDVLTLGLEVGRRFHPRVEGRLLLTANESDVGTVDAPDGPADTLGFFASRSLGDVRRLSADARVNVSLTPTTVVTAGFEFEQESERSFNEFSSEFGPTTGSTDVHRENRAVYGQLVAAVGAAGLTAGARVEDNERYGTQVTVRGGVSYGVEQTHTILRGSVGTAIKEPTFFETFATGFVRGNPDLDPERSVSWEVGIDQTLLAGQLGLTATYFNQSFEDLIQFTFTPPDPADPNYFNVGSADAWGVELFVRWERGPAFARTSYTYLRTEATDAGFDIGPDATFVEGERLLRRPTHTASLTGGYRQRPVTASMTLTVIGERTDLFFPPGSFSGQRVELPAYATVDVTGEFDLRRAGPMPGLTATLRVENLLDAEYEAVRGFASRGRTVFVGLRAPFGTP